MTVPVQMQEAALARHQSTVKKTLHHIEQLIHASFRPLPTQTGDGSEIERVKPSHPLEDLASLQIDDCETILETLLEKVKGGPTDDKTYIMERVIEVSRRTGMF